MSMHFEIVHACGAKIDALCMFLTCTDRRRGGPTEGKLALQCDAEQTEVDLEQILHVGSKNRARQNGSAHLADLALLLDHADGKRGLIFCKAAVEINEDQPELAAAQEVRRRAGGQVDTSIAADQTTEVARGHDELYGGIQTG